MSTSAINLNEESWNRRSHPEGSKNGSRNPPRLSQPHLLYGTSFTCFLRHTAHNSAVKLRIDSQVTLAFCWETATRQDSLPRESIHVPYMGEAHAYSFFMYLIIRSSCSFMYAIVRSLYSLISVTMRRCTRYREKHVQFNSRYYDRLVQSYVLYREKLVQFILKTCVGLLKIYLMTLAVSGRKRFKRNRRTMPAECKTEENHEKPVGRTGVWAGIQIQHLPNTSTSHECYSLCQSARWKFV